MKKLILNCCALFFVCHAAIAQIGIGTATPDNSAVLHLSSTTKGLLVPSMTSAQRNSIASPAEGLIVYDLTASRLYYYQNGTWRFFLDNQYWAGSTTRNWVYNGSDSIGIGTAAPNERLHVNGNIRTTGELKVSGNAGIGVLAAEHPLHVRTTTPGEGILLDAVNPRIQLRQSNTPAAGYTDKGFIQLSGDDLRIGTNSSNTTGKLVVRTGGADRIDMNEEGISLKGEATVRQASTGTASMLPACYGTISSAGNVVSGTGNFTVSKIGTGLYVITCNKITANSVLLATPQITGSAVNPSTAFHATHQMRLSFNGNDTGFGFMIYTP